MDKTRLTESTIIYLIKMLKSKYITALFLCVIFGVMPCSANAIDIVANASIDTEVLTTRELRAVFSLRLKHWPNGLPITVIAFNKTDLHNSFCKQLLQIFPHQLKLGWDRVTFSGLGQAPVIVKTQKEMVAAIKNIPGAIGYLDFAEVNDGEFIKKMRLDDK